MRKVAEVMVFAFLLSGCAGGSSTLSPSPQTSGQSTSATSVQAQGTSLQTEVASSLSAAFGTSKTYHGGFNGTIVISNASGAAVNWSSLTFSLAGGASISANATVWGAANAVTNNAGIYTMTPGRNHGSNPVPARGTVEIEYTGTGTFNGVGTACTIDQSSCANSATASPTPQGTPTPSGAPDLNPNIAPGGNFNLSLWELDLPLASGDSVKIIPSSQLVGSNGFTDSFFYTAADGGMAFFAPEDGARTSNSNYPRSELREVTASGADANWAMTGTNTLTATLKVVNVIDHTCVGQVHIGSALQPGLASSTKPLLELYYYANGNLTMGLEKSPSGSQTTYKIGTVPVGTIFTYSIAVSGDTITITLNGVPHVFTASSSFNGYGMYFKAGDYLQETGTSSTIGSLDEFYALGISH